MELYTIKDVTKKLHIGRNKVFQLKKDGQLKFIWLGRGWATTDEELKRFVARKQEETCPT